MTPRSMLPWILRVVLLTFLPVGLPGFGAMEAAAQSVPDVVESLEVSGNLRVERDAILNRSRLRPGDRITPAALGDTIRGVYELGLFRNIEIDAAPGTTGYVVTILVTEKPAVAEIVYEGLDELDRSDVDEVLTFQRGQVLDESRVRASARAIVNLYREKGYYLIDVTSRIEEARPGEVRVVYTLREGAKVKVARVRFVGNTALSDEQLQSVMMTREGGLLDFLTSFGTFQRENFQADMQRILFLHYDSGYLDVAVGDPLVELSRDRTEIYITIPIQEGQPYDIADVSVSGELLIPQEEVMRMVTASPGRRFSSTTMRTDIERLTNFYKDQGYANVNVNLLTNQSATNRTIGIQYDVELGELCYIGRIEFRGNALTRERVMRRELLIDEGDQYSGTRIRRSRDYVRRLGFFEDVTYRERANPNNPRIIDIEFEVTERPTRSIQVGAGFSSVDSFIATAQIAENNLFGRGQSLTLNLQLSAIRTIFILSFFEPRLLGSEVQFGVDLFKRAILLTEFERDSQGVGLTLGYRPFGRHDYWRDLALSVGYNLESVRIRNQGLFGRTLGVITRRFSGGLTSSISATALLDRRDDRMFAANGYYLLARGEIAEDWLGSENEFYRLTGIVRLYSQPRFLNCGPADTTVGGTGGGFTSGACRWFRNWVGRVNFEIGYVGTTNPEKDVPVFERYYVGGPLSVRGFQRLTLSPTEPAGASSDPYAPTRNLIVGGYKQIIVNVELEFPLLTTLGLSGVVFADAGNAFSQDQPYSLRLDAINGMDGSVLRTALGFGIRWRSPIGPLRFEWGYPLVPQPGEDTSVFEFSIQNAF